MPAVRHVGSIFVETMGVPDVEPAGAAVSPRVASGAVLGGRLRYSSGFCSDANRQEHAVLTTTWLKAKLYSVSTEALLVTACMGLRGG